MKSFQSILKTESDINDLTPEFQPDIVLLFISPSFPNAQKSVEALKAKFPESTFAGCSTSGEIVNTNVIDNSIIFNALKFDKTKHKLASDKMMILSTYLCLVTAYMSTVQTLSKE